MLSLTLFSSVSLSLSLAPFLTVSLSRLHFRWHQVGAIQANPTLGSLLNTGWKKNPNERKHVATNRRRK